MAQSNSHKWGQIIGDFLESVFLNELRKFADKHNLYLDYQGMRSARTGKKVTWMDAKGNKHDLDFVLERGGTENEIGTPVAFIESAWRRYTKHSRNKAQEIQGAIMPLVSTHSNYAPFIGVMLAGNFTQGALNQLDSLGFNILYFPYEMINRAFEKFGIDSSSEENTTEKDFQRKIVEWSELDDQQRDQLGTYLLKLNERNLSSFFSALQKSLARHIKSIGILPLHGKSHVLENIDEAINFILNYKNREKLKLLRYEITINYSNGDSIKGAFKSKKQAKKFLESYAPPKPT
ncbi:MAG: hypothetical protein K9I94_07015 [Bacteroidales bacterium]|nr:hypothetical protein [Bacteroidales bacterium]